MTKKANKKTSEYKVGPGNPPREYQWPKGVSGNPRGRPRKKQIGKLLQIVDPVSAMVLEHDKKKLTRMVDGEPYEQTRGEAALEAIYAKGMKGSIRALELYWKIRDQAVNAELETRRDIFQAASIHKDHWGPKFKSAEAQGKAFPAILPHPDDIILDYEHGSVDIIGPVTWDDQNIMEKAIKERDGIIQTVLRIVDDPEFSDDLKQSALENGQGQVAKINGYLPPRLRRDIP